MSLFLICTLIEVIMECFCKKRGVYFLILLFYRGVFEMKNKKSKSVFLQVKTMSMV